MRNYHQIGEIIKNARVNKKMTQEDLAGLLFTTKQAVSGWECGRYNPGEESKRRLAEVLGIDFSNINENRMSSDMLALEKIDNIDELTEIVAQIINKIKLDNEYNITIRYMLELAVFLCLGYEIYYMKRLRKKEMAEDLSWSTIAWDIRNLVNDRNFEPVPVKTSYLFSKRSLMLNKIEFTSYLIGGELFEDVDEEKYEWNEGFEQQIGRIAEHAGYELTNLIPDNETSIIVVYKVALLKLADILEEV